MPTSRLVHSVLPAVLLLLWLAAPASAAPPRDDREGRAEAALVAKGDDFLIHAAPYPGGP